MKIGLLEFTLSDIEDLFRRIPFFRKKYDKSNTHILFVDDEYKDFSIIQNLQTAQWFVTAVSDINNVEDDFVKNSQIIFVDYKGVGKNFSGKEQGIALIRHIKTVYGDSKRVILYSGHDMFSLGDKFNAADDWLPKNSDTREFLEKIHDNIRQLK